MSEYIYEHSRCHDHFGKPLDAPMLTQREEIVRCRDCKHATELVDDEGLPIEGLEDWFSCHGRLVTTWDYYNDEPKSNPVEPIGFYAWGEKKGTE